MPALCLHRRQGVHCNRLMVGNLICLERVSVALPVLPLLTTSLSMDIIPLCRALRHCSMHHRTRTLKSSFQFDSLIAQ